MTNEYSGIVAQFVNNLDPDVVDQIARIAQDMGVADSRAVSNFLVSLDVRAMTERQVAALKCDIQEFERQISQKRRFLAKLQQSIDMQKERLNVLKLSPQQLALIEKYNRSVSHDPSLGEWIKAHQTWFDVAKDLLVGVFFLWFGIRVERWRVTRSRTRLLKKA